LITINNISLNNSDNKTFLIYKDTLEFKENHIYFIIGSSGIGKTSLVDFIASPFTDDPIKNGSIKLSENIGIKNTDYNIVNSHNFRAGKYVDFIRKSVAYIPQKTDSFHPSKPIIKQMYDFYSSALPAENQPLTKKIRKHFISKRGELDLLLNSLCKYAGWDDVLAGKDNDKEIQLIDKKDYIDADTSDIYNVIDKDIKKIYTDNLSTGQLQRLFILMGLIQFTVSDNPILIGDEFLVNFTYLEAEDVLKKIIEYFNIVKKKQKLAIFILHDLSFKFLASLNIDCPVSIIGVEEDKNFSDRNRKKEAVNCRKIITHEISASDFFSGNWKDNSGASFFENIKESYESKSLNKNQYNFDITVKDEKYRYDMALSQNNYDSYLKEIKEENLFKGNFNLELKKNCVTVITGFSGCGKSTLSKLYLDNNIPDKRTFRYFPDRALSSISEDSQISISDDLMLIYNYYNDLNSSDFFKDTFVNNELMNALGKIIGKAHFYKEKTTITDNDIKDFLNKKIYDLSGGEQQRYWFIRLLLDYSGDKANCKKPALFVLDESIASLDCNTKNEIIGFILQEVFSVEGASMLLISHDLRDISVIYQTLLEKAGKSDIEKIFEHYEMIDGNLFQVKENFTDYWNNLTNKKGNKYYSLRDKKMLNLKLKENSGEN